MQIIPALALGLITLATVVRGQSTAAPASSLELRIEPENLQKGLPQAFRFVLINRGDHEIRVPVPVLECGASYTGEIWLGMHFTPLQPKQSSGLGHGCAADMAHWPGILERVRNWRTLRPNETLEVSGDIHKLFVTYSEAGFYEFWANYTPPFISPEDMSTLQRAGIEVSHERLSSSHITFAKKQ